MSCASIALFSATPLSFGPDGELKIVQFTDNHYKWGKRASKAAVECVESVLDAEQPDFVMFTGDLVYSDNVARSIEAMLKPVIDRGLPFAYVFGNHDADYDMSHAEIYDYISSFPGALIPGRGELESPDYTIEVRASEMSDSVAAVLYCLDSHAGSQYKGIGSYDWLRQSQILWYKGQSTRYKDANGGKPVPSLMFIHIPLPEVDYAYEDKKNYVIGSKGEKVCCPALNSGMFSSIIEQGDVKGVFFGHDHDNDFATGYYGVLLAYGRYSGGNTVYNHIGKNGARVITIKEGSPDIDTYIRLSNGEIINNFSFPSDMSSKKRKK